MPFRRGRLGSGFWVAVVALLGAVWLVGFAHGSTVAVAGEAPEVSLLPSVQALEIERGVPADTLPELRSGEELIRTYVRGNRRPTPELARRIYEAARAHGIDPQVAFGLVRVESGFRPNAVGPGGAAGLTQIMPRTAAWLRPGTTPRDLRSPELSLDLGFGYLRELKDRYDGDVRLALLAYNRGPGTVDRALRRGANPDNGYVERVLGRQARQ